MNKYRRIDSELVLQNVERMLLKASSSHFDAGRTWYWEANEFAKRLGVKYDLEDWKVASLIAVLSPLKEWSLNKRITEEFILGKRDIHFSLQVNKAIQILKLDAWSKHLVSEILVGQKTVSFYNNILDPSNPDFVTVDTHLLDALLWKGANITPQRYTLIEQTIKDYSIEQAKLIPCETQAIIWVTHKHLKKTG